MAKNKTTTLSELDYKTLLLLPEVDPGRLAIQSCTNNVIIANAIGCDRKEAQASFRRLKTAGLAQYMAPYSVRPSGWYRTRIADKIVAAAGGKPIASVTHLVEEKQYSWKYVEVDDTTGE